MPARSLFRRGLALTLLVATIGGPAGVLSAFHPFDDLACLPFSGDRPTALVEEGSDFHCPTCHLLRSVRWSLSVVPDAGVAVQVVHALPVPAPAIGSDPAHLAIRGRSPPPAAARTAL
jgi:hypothetical protein